jgi:hypothetical protein
VSSSVPLQKVISMKDPNVEPPEEDWWPALVEAKQRPEMAF